MGNKAVHKKGTEKSKTKESHPNSYDEASKSKRTETKNLNKTLKNLLPNNVKTRIQRTGQKLSSIIQIKDKQTKSINTILVIMQNVLNHLAPKNI